MTGSAERIAAACQRAGAVLAVAEAEVGDAAREGGPGAVARQAEPHASDRRIAELAAYYQQLQAQAGGSTAA